MDGSPGFRPGLFVMDKKPLAGAGGCRAATSESFFTTPASHVGDCRGATLGVMPKVFEKDGYSFFFYSNDHSPIHIHVKRGEGEAVFAIEPEVSLRESVGFNVRELSRAEELIHDHVELIRRKWAEHLG